MRVESRTKEQLITELSDAQKRISELEKTLHERRHTEEDLAKSEERYRSIFEQTGNASILIAEDTTIILANSKFEKLSGYSKVELEGKMSWTVFPDREDLARMRTYHGARMKGTGSAPSSYEFRLVTRSGDTRDILLNIGMIVGSKLSIASLMDITESRHAEKALRESEDKFSRIFRMSPDIITITRVRDGVYIDVNDEFTRHMGYTREEVIGRSSFALDIWVDVSDRDRLTELLRTKGGLQGEEFRFRCKDGSIKTGGMSARIITIEGELCILGMFRDITEKIEAQKAQYESEEKFRSVVEKSLVGIAIIDDALCYAYVNEEYCRIAGYSEQEMLGRIFTFPLAEESLALVTERFQRRQRGEEVPSHYEFSFLQKKGSRRIGEVRSAVYLDSSEKVKTIIQVIDVTDRKRAEEEKWRLKERLNRAEKMEALGTLAGGVAHDLNNVLGVVIGYAELLVKRGKETDPITSGLLNIKKGGERAAAIVQDLLTLARRGVSAREVLNLNRIAADFQNSPELETLISYHPSVRIETELEPDLLNISGSSVHLGKTLFNLVSNACEAMPEGGILTVRTANEYLDKPLRGYDEIREGDYAVLTVSDTGEGIAPRDLNQIFEPFYTKKVMGRSGTGLGLAVVWGTVKDHNGYINVQSEEGKGSTFTLYFPITRQEPSAAAATVSVSEFMGRGESILVVDDVREQRELAAELLRELHYRVEVAESGEEALAYLREHRVDLVVLDMIMDPGMDGFDTYRRILEIHPGQKAIIVSGFSDTDRVRKAQALGAGDYVRKPYLIEKLGTAVRKELDRSL